MGRIPRCFVFLVVLLQPLKLAEMADAPFWYCASSSTYTANSTFDHNLRRALASLAANVSLAGFYNATVGKKPDEVIAVALCRGDLDGEACQACVSESATQVIQRCPSNRGAFFVLRGCISYYRDTNFTIPQSFLNFSQSSPDAIPDPQNSGLYSFPSSAISSFPPSPTIQDAYSGATSSITQKILLSTAQHSAYNTWHHGTVSLA
ncbi:putative cysteine-rich receptor-like protein kinase 9 [Nymphaea colorata]|uniref:putative cysteine-rich receptor-like protein kinase 9 n=1 Tax=Nymphaea colorata TaxID=210225 RepID=UPI00214F5B35|nr:putative cysteine-rich receptor-like protein kinase 9 [Nymphaea colorata]